MGSLLGRLRVSLLFLTSICSVSPALAQPASHIDANGLGSLDVNLRPISREGKVVSIEVEETIACSETPHPIELKTPLVAFGVKHIADRIHDLSVTGNALPIPLEIHEDPQADADARRYRHWTSNQVVPCPIRVRYTADLQPDSEPANGPPYGIRSVGDGVAGGFLGFFVLPEATTVHDVRVRWDLAQIGPNAVGVITAGANAVRLNAPAKSLFDQWLLAGTATTLHSRTGFHGYLLGSPSYSAQGLLQWANTSYETLSSNFRRGSSVQYNLMIRVLAGKSFTTGTAFHGGALVNTSNPFYDGQGERYLKNTVFHEMTHDFVGEVEGDHSWFNEGLVVYSSAVLPYRRGLISEEDYVAELNRFTVEYYHSKARNWAAGRIETLGMTDEQARRVPYDRGALYYAALDEQIRLRSHGKRDIYAFVAPLLKQREATNHFEQADFEAILRSELGEAAVQEFRAVMIDGTADPSIPADAFGKCIQRVESSWALPDGGMATGYSWKAASDAPGCPLKPKKP